MIPTDHSALRAPVILKHLKSAHFPAESGYFSVFCGSQSHVLACKHAIHALLTLASSHEFVNRLVQQGNRFLVVLLHRFHDAMVDMVL